MISILIPSYGRPTRVAEVVKNAHLATFGEHEIVVIVEPRELEVYFREFENIQCAALLAQNNRTPSYAGAVNAGLTEALGNYIFMGADDLDFHNGWDIEAMHTMLALPNIKVVGTNDLLNEYVLKGWHSTHSLVDRRYIEDIGGVVDGEKGVALYEGYTHNYVDTEFIGTAKVRAVFAPCPTSIVEHNHFTVGKSSVDPTYLKGNLHLQEDHDLYESRKHLWWDLSK